MSVREILTFADVSEAGVARLRMAQAVAEVRDAHLDVDVIAPLFAPLTPMEPEVMAALYEQERVRARKEGAQVAAELRKSCGAPDRAAVHVRDLFFSEIRDYAARAARSCDLVIAAQPERMDGVEAELLIGALLGGGRPALMLPRWIQPHTWGKRVFIAWKGTPEAARAVKGALPFIAEAEAVRICVANPRGERHGEDERSLDRLATYLMRHGAKAESPIATSSWEGPEKLFPSEIEGFNADLVVMGAYGHSRARELVFGGMTEMMVRNARTAVLFAH
jgi:nucleotide-binding universal stress UspA family protein